MSVYQFGKFFEAKNQVKPVFFGKVATSSAIDYPYGHTYKMDMSSPRLGLIPEENYTENPILKKNKLPYLRQAAKSYGGLISSNQTANQLMDNIDAYISRYNNEQERMYNVKINDPNARPLQEKDYDYSRRPKSEIDAIAVMYNIKPLAKKADTIRKIVYMPYVSEEDSQALVAKVSKDKLMDKRNRILAKVNPDIDYLDIFTSGNLNLKGMRTYAAQLGISTLGKEDVLKKRIQEKLRSVGDIPTLNDKGQQIEYSIPYVDPMMVSKVGIDDLRYLAQRYNVEDTGTVGVLRKRLTKYLKDNGIIPKRMSKKNVPVQEEMKIVFDLTKGNVKQLKEALKRMGLPVSGTKPILLKRINDFFDRDEPITPVERKIIETVIPKAITPIIQKVISPVDTPVSPGRMADLNELDWNSGAGELLSVLAKPLYRKLEKAVEDWNDGNKKVGPMDIAEIIGKRFIKRLLKKISVDDLYEGLNNLSIYLAIDNYVEEGPPL